MSYPETERILFYLENSNDLYTQIVVRDGANYGRDQAKTRYPYAVSRNEGEVRQLGEQQFQVWEDTLRNYKSLYSATKSQVEKWNSEREETKRLFASVFTEAYLETVAEKDKKTGRSPVASPTGVTVTVLDVKHTAHEHVYTIEIIDPGHLTKPAVIEAEISEP
jgi:hypothetical protein